VDQRPFQAVTRFNLCERVTSFSPPRSDTERLTAIGACPEETSIDSSLRPDTECPNAIGASLGRTTPLRTLSLTRLTDIAEIWNEAERRLKANRAYFSLVVNSRYLPQGDTLHDHEYLPGVRPAGTKEFVDRRDRVRNCCRRSRVANGSRSGDHCIRSVCHAWNSTATGYDHWRRKLSTRIRGFTLSNRSLLRRDAQAVETQ
jgi:hypothetical protein